MKKTIFGTLEYEQPQISILAVEIEQGFAQSSQLDDMKESEGQWEY